MVEKKVVLLLLEVVGFNEVVELRVYNVKDGDRVRNRRNMRSNRRLTSIDLPRQTTAATINLTSTTPESAAMGAAQRRAAAAAASRWSFILERRAWIATTVMMMNFATICNL